MQTLYRPSVPSWPVPSPGARGVQYLFAEAFSGNTCKEGWLSPHELGTCAFQSKHNIPNETRETPRRRKPKKKVPSSTKEHNPRTKKKRSPEATSLLQPRNPKEPKTKDQERSVTKSLQELLFHAKMCFTNEEEASLYRIWEGLV